MTVLLVIDDNRWLAVRQALIEPGNRLWVMLVEFLPTAAARKRRARRSKRRDYRGIRPGLSNRAMATATSCLMPARTVLGGDCHVAPTPFPGHVTPKN